jgi:hypothetical protein
VGDDLMSFSLSARYKRRQVLSGETLSLVRSVSGCSPFVDTKPLPQTKNQCAACAGASMIVVIDGGIGHFSGQHN